MSRKDPKTIPVWLKILLLPLLLVPTGCFAPGTMPAAPLEGVIRRVCARHDASVSAVTSLSPAAKRQALLDSKILLKNLDAALED